jgi:hypothetical protein
MFWFPAGAHVCWFPGSYWFFADWQSLTTSLLGYQTKPWNEIDTQGGDDRQTSSNRELWPKCWSHHIEYNPFVYIRSGMTSHHTRCDVFGISIIVCEIEFSIQSEGWEFSGMVQLQLKSCVNFFSFAAFWHRLYSRFWLIIGFLWQFEDGESIMFETVKSRRRMTISIWPWWFPTSEANLSIGMIYLTTVAEAGDEDWFIDLDSDFCPMYTTPTAERSLFQMKIPSMNQNHQ